MPTARVRRDGVWAEIPLREVVCGDVFRLTAGDLVLGPISSLFDFLTFYVLLQWFHASETLFHTGWFLESLATQTLVLFVIRTMGNPFRSRPSRWLTITTLGIVVIGALLPVTPLAAVLGFTPLPWSYVAFLIPVTVIDLGMVDVAKRWLARRLAL